MTDTDQRKAEFLWPHEEGSIKEAGYEFANARTESYRELWWGILLEVAKTEAEE